MISSQKQISFVQIETGFLCEIGCRNGARVMYLFVCSCDSAVGFLDSENSSQRRLLLRLAPRRVHFPRPWTQASKPALADSSLAAYFFQPSIRAQHDDLLLLLLLLLCVYSRMIRSHEDARWVRCSSWSLGPTPRRPTANCSLAAERRGECVRASSL